MATAVRIIFSIACWLWLLGYLDPLFKKGNYMTDLVRGFVVTLNKDMREDDADSILAALEMVKGVYSVKPVISDIHDMMAKEQALRDIREKVYEVLK
jgi:hypothetical protein